MVCHPIILVNIGLSYYRSLQNKNEKDAEYFNDLKERGYEYVSIDGNNRSQTMVKYKIPTHDPNTGELNPYYEELTGKRNPLKPKIISIKDHTKDKNIEKMPDQKWHQIISFIKSGIRIIGYILIPFDLIIAAIVLVVSEIIGIVEELV